MTTDLLLRGPTIIDGSTDAVHVRQVQIDPPDVNIGRA
jgi:hypothetical protein